MLSQIEQSDVGREALPDELYAGERHDDLPAVSRGHQAGDAVEGRTEVVAFSDVGGPDVQAHPDGKITEPPPRLPLQRPLRSESGVDPCPWRREYGAYPVPVCLKTTPPSP